jgi:hypothetical protein
MSRPVLLGFGDSWAFGAGVEQHENYINLLAKQLNIDCYNLAKCSTGIPHLIVQLKEFVASKYYLPQQNYTAVFFISAMERDIIFNSQGQPEELHPQNDDSEHYYKHIYSDYLTNFRLNTNLLTLRQLCNFYNINDHYIFGWQTPTLWLEIDKNKFWQEGKKSIMHAFLGDNIDPSNYNINFLKNGECTYLLPLHHPRCSHPNQLGHIKITELLCEWIQI